MEIIQGLQEGTYLRNNTYRIVKVLGQGGFGITYLAFDENLERYVAIKEFFPQGYCNRDQSTSHVTTVVTSATDLVEKLRTKFLKEAKNIAKFDHPGIIKIHAAFEENNTAYYVMEFIDGGSLDDYVKKNGPLSDEQAKVYMNRIGHALQYIHARRINHLDIKPANIMVRASDGQPILIDFGVSKQYDYTGHQTSTSPVGLSHGYSPLEQYQAGGINEFSPKTDLYSFAATFYYLLTGNHPPQAALLLDNELEFPSRVNPIMVNAIKRAMSASRNNRQDDISAFLSELNAAEHGNESGSAPSFKEDNNLISAENSAKHINENFNSKKTANNIKKAESTIISSAKSAEYPLDEHKNSEINSIVTEKSKNRGKIFLVIGCVAAVLVIGIVVFLISSSHNEKSEDKAAATENIEQTEANREVTDMMWKSSFGNSLYSGELGQNDSGDWIPNGKGKFEITDGEFKGASYAGEFVMGRMEGQGTYTMKSGDIFVGKMKDDAFDDGRYTSLSTGEYFEGKFRNGEPFDGKWYDKSGKVLETVSPDKSLVGL